MAGKKAGKKLAFPGNYLPFPDSVPPLAELKAANPQKTWTGVLMVGPGNAII